MLPNTNIIRSPKMLPNRFLKNSVEEFLLLYNQFPLSEDLFGYIPGISTVTLWLVSSNVDE